MWCGERVEWGDLKTKGFLHVEQFLTTNELSLLHEDYLAQTAKSPENGNYNLPPVSQQVILALARKIRKVSEAVLEATGINADMNLPGMYFATERGIKFAWHQDYESYFSLQQHSDYLNFYIPIVKPDARRTNLCVVPFDLLLARTPEEGERIIGAGAQSFYPEGDCTRVTDDENGREYALPVNIESLQVTPHLSVGDLLLLRGDMIHRTQDTDTDRVAVSFRRTSSSAIIRKARTLSGCPAKQLVMSKNPTVYGEVLESFAEARKDEIPARQLFALTVARQARRLIEKSKT